MLQGNSIASPRMPTTGRTNNESQSDYGATSPIFMRDSNARRCK